MLPTMNPENKTIFRAIGLMSGTSMDGIDVALMETDGEGVVRNLKSLTLPYDERFRGCLREVVNTAGNTALLPEVERELDRQHIAAVKALLADTGLAPAGIDVVGYHGHTVLHEPLERFTRQIGCGATVARALGITVVNDFRSADVAAGGQGAPLVPLYHQALAAGLERPLAVVNIGGVANLTYLGTGDPVAFDTGPGNALLDDLLLRHTGVALDAGGQVAASGQADEVCLTELLAHPYFARAVPKSLDRNAFDAGCVNRLSLPDAAATLVAFTAESIARAREVLPEMPRRWLVTGGGRHNRAMMAALAERLQVPVEPVESVGWDGDGLEAQAFAYLAVRSCKGLPLTMPTTTGVPQPLTGGILHAA
jgi:anhydro-N-acetylmuramic acid kinase